ncbi:hypothetical protein SPI_03444 [Niveomyces insectorum RCEF 264]|uniref:Uncharacterized protein n=1 Tax=Niveomyces insectorum RCEF 264 TaxID=1081102 RepID=A0A167W358_9HYPO|nr:hypothetical protein SPI_03444 [Niveomyces insectorum RCEF 264]
MRCIFSFKGVSRRGAHDVEIQDTPILFRGCVLGNGDIAYLSRHDLQWASTSAAPTLAAELQSFQ